ncbi:hypothetical protein AIOL_003836 [Candidatus Rhodobacter oscarellae]|uniref:Glycosyltransferase RgtA/B/C/D-like domain-containing protein n=1 Tax=Candidatus Rhodobacter oscarellae TaxID=1675527 RepID=A0A0J9E7Y8_9RHOB|nr:glycosyltransferase family 39 protein [Candidatus Rhodobacter lobularis]KMW58855.1 hypothetical protein AIOL_003836 [Candidatus Rhodobacter lobularis]
MTDRSWLAPALLGVGLVTLARVVLLALNRTDLFVDEAQYWLWGQELAFGYYSKPPMIGWVIRAFTELGGSDAQFWVRLPGPLFHGATALILGAVAARLFGRTAAILTAMAYVTLPMVAVGSLLISTDTIMFPFLALALLGYLRVLEGDGARAAILTGAALGLAFLSKYAAIYYVLCAVLALVVPSARPSWRGAATILVAFLVTASPNLIWNIANGLTTVQHTLDNADWVRDPSARAGLNPGGLAEFFFAQFAVFGPVLFGALLWAALRWSRLSPPLRMLLLFALPIVAIVCVQALLSRAYANWAAAAYLAGLLVVIPRLTRPWLIASFAVNGFLCLLFPLATTAPEFLARDGQPLLNRYLGRHALSQQILQAAEDAGLDRVVAGDRDLLADLFYTGRDHPAQVFAMPVAGRPPHHYAQRFAFEGQDGEVLLVLHSAQAPPCAASVQIAEVAPTTGAYRGHPFSFYRTPAECIRP